MLKMYSKTLEWEAIPLKDFKENGFENKVGCLSLSWRQQFFYKKALVFLCSRSEQLTCATTLPWYGTGLSS
jgi:hypothetical protein